MRLNFGWFYKKRVYNKMLSCLPHTWNWKNLLWSQSVKTPAHFAVQEPVIDHNQCSWFVWCKAIRIWTMCWFTMLCHFSGTSAMATCWLRYSRGIFLKTLRCITTILEIPSFQSNSTGRYWNLWVEHHYHILQKHIDLLYTSNPNGQKWQKIFQKNRSSKKCIVIYSTVHSP